jgi:hypothetical protein
VIEKFAIAFSLMLVIEGIMPFIAPRSWRQMFMQLMSMNDKSIRIMGLASMLFGVLLLYVVN